MVGVIVAVSFIVVLFEVREVLKIWRTRSDASASREAASYFPVYSKFLNAVPQSAGSSTSLAIGNTT